MKIKTKIELTRVEVDAIDVVLEMLDHLQPEEEVMVDKYLFDMQCVDTKDIFNALYELRETYYE